MTTALKNFELAMRDANNLLTCYDSLNAGEQPHAPEVLKRATLIMILTAWETYVEDLASEMLNSKFGILKGSHVGKFIQDQLSVRLKTFNNPDSLKTKRLFEEFFGIDVTEKWEWNNYVPKQARTALNKWLKMRGEAVHRAQIDITKPHIVKRDDLEKCIRFFSDLVKSTDNALSEEEI